MVVGESASVRCSAFRCLLKLVVSAADAIGRSDILVVGEGEATPFKSGGSLGHDRPQRYFVTQIVKACRYC